MKTRGPLLWRWSVRDLRARWMQVLGIALIIALGVAIFGGLGSAGPWRTRAYDESFEMLNMHDLKIKLPQGSYLEAERLAQAVRAIPHAEWIQALDLRLSFPTTVDASTPDETVLVAGRIIGVEMTGGGPDVDQLHVTAGRALTTGDAGEPVCIVEHNFAAYYDLEPGDWPLYVGGGQTLRAVGVAMSPEHFMVVQEEAGFLGMMAQDRYAVLFVPLGSAQAIAEYPGMVNEALIVLPEGGDAADLDRLQAELEAALGQAFPQVSFEFEQKSENLVYTLSYEDVASGQQNLNTWGIILLVGAAFGAFILIGRVVDAQRREIGIHMALGVSPWRIARRYVLFGAQIALLGMGLGVALGLLVNRAIGPLIAQALPTPYFETPFQLGVFLRGAIVGLIIPFLAIVYPIWRAVRVTPVDAIQTGFLVSQGGRLSKALAQVPLPGSSLAQVPLRNLSRGLRRTLMTVLGIAMAIVVLMIIIGMVDTVRGTVDAGAEEIKKGAPERTLVTLDDFYPLAGDLVSQVTADPRVADVVPAIELPGQALGDANIDVLIHLLDLDNALWTPTVTRGEKPTGTPGLLITAKAARDLGVDVGDDVTLRHLYRESQYAWRYTETRLPVTGIHPGLLRTSVYMDLAHVRVLNLDGSVNTLHVNPASGIAPQELRRDLAQRDGISSVQRASAGADGVMNLFGQYFDILWVIELIVLVIALLIAYNTTRSNIDERRRDIATMFAFGTRVRTVVRMAVIENLITGVLGTGVGLGLGWLLLGEMLRTQVEAMQPELNMVTHVSGATFVWAVLIGIVVVALTPVLTARRLTRMDIPSTLRVVE